MAGLTRLVPVPRGNGRIIAVAGGVDGADLGFLEAAESLNWSSVGYVLKGYRSEAEGDALAARFGLTETTTTKSKLRNQENVRACTRLVIILQANGSQIENDVDGEARKTGRFYLDGDYELDDMFYPDDDDGYVNLVFSNNAAVLVLYVRNGELDSLQHSEVIDSLRVYLEPPRDTKMRVMISGPSEETLPGIREAVRKLFVSTFAS